MHILGLRLVHFSAQVCGVQPPQQYSCTRRGCEERGGLRDPASGIFSLSGRPRGGAAPLPRAHPEGAAPARTPGIPSRAPSVPGKKAQARSRQRCSGSAANHGGVFPGGTDVVPGKASLRAGRPPGTPRLRRPPGRPESGGSPGLCKAAAPPVVQLRSRAQLLLPEGAAAGEGPGWLLAVITSVRLSEQTSQAEAEPAAARNSLQTRLLCRSPRGEKPSLCEEVKRVMAALPTAMEKKRVFWYLPLPCT
ncbi:uncharacterized protein ACIB01_008568 [Guaruba guarouba]